MPATNMFERLTDAFQGLYRRLAGQNAISESNVREAMVEVRSALIDADVHVEVVEAFCDRVLKASVGREVSKTLRPEQEMIGIVHEELVRFLGGVPKSEEEARQAAAELAGPLTAGLTPGGAGGGLGASGGVAGQMPGRAPGLPGTGMPGGFGGLSKTEPIMRVSPGPTVVMMCGLQGSGKTTTCGKLAAFLKKRGRSVMLVAADLQRPAAVEQLEIVAKQVQAEAPGGGSVTFYGEPDKSAEYGKAVGVAVQVCQRALAEARARGVDTVILDTAGRLHVNDELMGELGAVRKVLVPHHIFLVVDAMTGQDAVNSAKSFHEKLDVDGIVLTKFDSDTRGGAALSVKHVTGAPIRFVGMGEKIDALEEFHADRFAGRILGMGDVLALVEKAHEQVSQEEAERLQEKISRGEMTMDDFLKQLKTLRRMGPMRHLLGLLPVVGPMLKNVNIDEKQLDRVEAMINSMTKVERSRPGEIDFSRRKRIAKGSGVKPEDVGQLVKQFEMISTLSRTMAGMSGKDKVDAVKAAASSKGGLNGLLPGLSGMPGVRTKGSSYTPSIKDRFEKRKKR